MKRFLCRIAVLLAVLGCCTACFTTMAALTAAVVLSNITPGERVNLSGRTVEALAPQGQAALMRTEGGDVVCIVYQFKEYKDNLRIKDKFVRGGLYAYTAADGKQQYVPIFIRVKDYKQLWPVAVDLDVNKESLPDQPELREA